MEYIAAKNENNNVGLLGLSSAVFETIAELSLEDLDDIKIARNSKIKKNTICVVNDGRIDITMDVLVKTGNNIKEVCTATQNHVLAVIKQMTDFSNVVVNINIKGFYI